MISGFKINDVERAKETTAEAYGKYALELINENRATPGIDLPALQWNQDLFDLAFTHIKDISNG